MKKIKYICAALATIIIITLLSGCNKQLIDLDLTFEKAIITLSDGNVITVEVKSWCDYEDSDQIQITAKDGTVYLVHSVNVTLIHE